MGSVPAPGYKKTANILFAYRLNDGEGRKKFRLRWLEPAREYEIRFENSSDKEAFVANGKQLMDEGIWVELPKRNSAAIISIKSIRLE